MKGADRVLQDINGALRVIVEHDLLAVPPNFAIRRDVGTRTQVTWPNSPKGTLRGTFGRFATVAEYRTLVENRQFNCVLKDGLLIMLSYQFSAAGALVEHSLYYYPCPLSLDPRRAGEEAQDEPDDEDVTFVDRFDQLLEDELREALVECDIYEGTCESRLLMRAPIRFDYAPDHASDNHAASHVHLAQADCRIPVYGPVSVGHFLRFVFGNYYPAWLDLCEGFAAAPDRLYSRELRDSHLGVLHVDWLTERSGDRLS